MADRASKYIEKKKEQMTPEEYNADVSNLLGRCFSDVFRDYLPEVASRYRVKSPSEPLPDPTQIVHYFDITKFVIEKNDAVFEKLKNVYHLLAFSGGSIALILNRSRNGLRLSIAVSAAPGQEESLAGSVKDAFLGNFPGSECSDVYNYREEKDDAFSTLAEVNFEEGARLPCVGIVSNISTDFTERFSVQGIEKLVDSVDLGNVSGGYTLILIGAAMTPRDVRKHKDSLAQIYTGLSPFSRVTKNWGESEGRSWTTSFNAGLNFGVSAEPKTEKKENDVLKLVTMIPKHIFPNMGGSIGASTSKTDNVSVSRGVAIEVENFSVSHTLRLLEKQMERLDLCEALGLWSMAGYVFSSDYGLTNQVAQTYMSLMQGKESYHERSAVNIWNGLSSDAETKKAIREIRNSVVRLRHPVFELDDEKKKDAAVYWPKKVSCTVTVSGDELTRAMILPRTSVPGLPVITCARFGREIASYDTLNRADVHLGRIHHMHRNETKEAALSSASLTSHVFITGSTGAGKSNTVYTLLNNAACPFLVIEPAKGEYGEALKGRCRVFGASVFADELLQLNPFYFPPEVHVLEHVDRLLEVFNVCWPMYAAMPAVLKDAVIRAYRETGWDTRSSQNSSGALYPTFEDVCREIDRVIEASDYSDENKGNYRGALKTRLNSLTNGVNGAIFCEGDLSNEVLFDGRTVVDLSRVGSAENKALIMGILVIRLQEYRMSTKKLPDQPLRHITVLEEAHHLLRRAPSSASPETGGGIAAKSVEMIANAIAEMRTYGEGFLIVDQSPELMDMSVIRNTNTKIIMRLPDRSDRELVGRAASLNDDQIEELAKLQRGIAAIYQNEWIEPVLCHIDRFVPAAAEKAPPAPKKTEDYVAVELAARYVHSCVYDPRYLMRRSELEFIDCVDKMRLPPSTKKLLLDYARTPLQYRKKAYREAAYRLFRIEDFIKENGLGPDPDEWENRLIVFLKKGFRFMPDTSFDAADPVRYAFVQMMLERCADGPAAPWKTDSPERVVEYMEYFRQKHFS